MIQSFSPIGIQFGTQPRFLSLPDDLASRNAKVDQHIAKTESPTFQQVYSETYKQAQRFIANQIQQGEKGFVVFDIDETTLDNRGFFADPEKRFYKKGIGLQALATGWQDWVQSMQIPVIKPAKVLIDWLNQNKVPYLFLTGIRESLQPFSEQNLKNAGVWGESCLGAFYRPDQFNGSTAAFKKDKRPDLEQTFNLPVMATVGDQPGDMVSDPKRNFKLPDYVKALRREND